MSRYQDILGRLVGAILVGIAMIVGISIMLIDLTGDGKIDGFIAQIFDYALTSVQAGISNLGSK